MLTLAAYAGYVRRPFSLWRYLLVTALFVLGLAAKPMLVTTPFLLLLLDFWPLERLWPPRTGKARNSSSPDAPGKSAPGRDAHFSGFDSARSPASPRPFAPRTAEAWPWRRVLLEKLPWLAIAAASCGITYWAQGTAVIDHRMSLLTRIANALVSSVAYLGMFVYPTGLAVFYPHWQTHWQFALPLVKVFCCLALLAGLSLAVLAGWRRCPYFLVGWLWYLGMLVPVSGLVQVGSQAMADRYTYLPQIGLYVAMAWGAARMAGAWRFFVGPWRSSRPSSWRHSPAVPGSRRNTGATARHCGATPWPALPRT